MSSYVSNTISGGINFAGIGSGTDFNEMIGALKQIEEIPKQRMTLWKGEWEYRIAAMEEVLKVMQEGKSTLSDFNSMSKMMDIKVDSSKKEVATATINSDSDLVEGNYSIDVERLATASLFSTKEAFPEKTSVINDHATEDKEFTYTYKGTTRTIECPPGTTLEQLLMRVNNDVENPGVRASLVKNGDAYMFQIQGKETGVESQLHVSSTLPNFEGSEHLFTAQDILVNGGVAAPFTLKYKGKDISADVGANETMEDWVTKFNAVAGNPAKASLVSSGSDYVIKYTDRSSGSSIMPPIVSEVAQLGGQSGVTNGATIINPVGEPPKSYSFTYLDTNYNIPVPAGSTLDDLATNVNTTLAASHPDVRGTVVPNASGTGFVLQINKIDGVMNPAAPTGSTQIVKYKVNAGTEFGFPVKPGTTMKEYAKLFNAQPSSSRGGIKASVTVDGAGNSVLAYENPDGTNAIPGNLDFGGTPDPTIKGIVNTGTPVPMINMIHEGGSSNIEGLGKKEIISGKDTIVNPDSPPGTGTPHMFTVAHGGTNYSYSVPAGTTLEELKTGFNADPANANMQMELIAGPSGYTIGFLNAPAPGGVPITPMPQTDASTSANLPLLNLSSEGWNIQLAQDAKFTINGWDSTPMTSSSNKLTEVIGGMTITMKSVGETHLSISSDTSKLEESIFTIIDTFNLMKGTILRLQKVDTDKIRSNPDADKMQSQFEWQAGSALTGNYGVQMILSSFSDITSGAAAGFVGMINKEDTLNDPFTALGQIGISTDTNPSSDSFGLLEIDSEKLSAAIKKDPEAIASLFSSTLTGKTTSSDFTVASAGMFATAGAYEVTYEADSSGSPFNVKINGAVAQTDPAFPGRFTVGDQSNPALGVAIQFNPGGLTETTGGAVYTGTIQLKQGKVNEMMAFLDDELKRTSVAGEPQGTLPTIISNYVDITKNIQTKIDKETKRISVWEQRQKLKYARLDAVLGQYNAQLESMESMLPTNN